MFEIIKSFLPYSCLSGIFSSPDIHYNPLSVTDQKLRSICEDLKRQYDSYENLPNPKFEGYRVTIETFPELTGIVTPYGQRTDEDLSRKPQEVIENQNECVFCHPHEDHIFKVYEDGDYIFKSIRLRKILLITKEHYPNWFKIPIETQMKLVYRMLEIRKQIPQRARGPIEFHCGSGENQNIFHFQGATCAYP